jgi:tetratricopeptide (TPR) repeat protein
MLGLIILIVIVGAAVTLFTVLLVRNLAAPRKVSSLEKLLKQGRTRQVIAGAKRILSGDPRSTDARYLLALSYLREERPELAMIEIRSINDSGRFTDFCKETEFRKQAAGLYDRFGQVDESLKEYLLLLKAEPGEPDHSFRVGELFEKRGDGDRAAGYYAKTIKLKPTHAEAWARLGCLQYRAKHTAEARKALEGAIKLDPGNSTASYYLGRILKEGGDPRGALKLLEQAARDPTLKAKALLEAGSCSLATGDNGKAIADLQRAIKAAGGDGGTTVLYVRYFLGLAYEKNREIEKAIEQWEMVHAAKATFRDVGEKLAEYRELRQDDGMKDYLTASAAEFGAMCRGVVEGIGLEVTSVKDIPDGCEFQGLERPTGMVQRRMSHLQRYLRPSKPVDDASVRAFLEQMKAQKADRGLIASSSGFTPRALTFAQTRPLDLADRDRILGLLRRRVAAG